MQKVQDTGCTDQIGQTVCSCSTKADRMEYCYDDEAGDESIIASERALKVKTTGLAGGLHCPYKGLLPTCARKAPEGFANRTSFSGLP